VTIFTDWVTGGGNLIAMRPDKPLTNLLGLTYVTEPNGTKKSANVLFTRVSSLWKNVG
jgi:hypothetical protein